MTFGATAGTWEQGTTLKYWSNGRGAAIGIPEISRGKTIILLHLASTAHHSLIADQEGS